MTISGHSVLRSTEKVEHRVESPLSDEAIQKIASKIDPELDAPVNHVLKDHTWRWYWPNWIRPKQRLTKEQAWMVQDYINAITRHDYPYQVREYMGRQLWLEFCEYYAINPDIQKAMRYL